MLFVACFMLILHGPMAIAARWRLAEAHIAQITRLYGAFEPNAQSKIFDNAEFGYATITIERPLRDA
jgi:type I restriction enzyme M protein